MNELPSPTAEDLLNETISLRLFAASLAKRRPDLADLVLNFSKKMQRNFLPLQEILAGWREMELPVGNRGNVLGPLILIAATSALKQYDLPNLPPHAEALADKYEDAIRDLLTGAGRNS